MLPNVAAHNLTHQPLGDSVLPCERRLADIPGSIGLSDADDILGGQFCQAVQLASRHRLGMPAHTVAFPARKQFGLTSGPVGIATRKTFRMHPVSRSITDCPTSLLPHVQGVLATGSQEEMVRPDAQAVISTGAVVADEEAARNITVRQAPRVDMGPNRPLAVSGAKVSIPVAGSSSPQPALTALVDLRPEPGDVRIRHFHNSDCITPCCNTQHSTDVRTALY